MSILNTYIRRIFTDTRRASLLIAALIGLLASALLVTDRKNIFTINAITEKAIFVVTDPLLSEWSMNDAKLLENPELSEDDRRTVKQDSILLIEPNTEVEIIRHGIQEIGIILRRDGENDSVGELTDNEGNKITLGPWASFIVNPTLRPLVLPFRGHLTIGDDVTVGVSRILLSGNVGVIEEQTFSNTRYTAGSEILDPGDRIHIWKTNSANPAGRTPAVMDGFIRIEPTTQSKFTDAQNAIQLVAHGQASYVEVQRLGSAGYTIVAPKWARILYDPSLAFLSTLVILILTFVEIYSKSKEIFGDYRRTAQAGPTPAITGTENTVGMGPNNSIEKP